MHSLIELIPITMATDDLLGIIEMMLAILILLLCGFLIAKWRSDVRNGSAIVESEDFVLRGYQIRK